MMLLAAVLVLQPVLAEDGDLRLVAAGVGDDPVVWTLDGVEVARTADREAAVVNVSAGVHELRASSAATGAWHALARPDGLADGAAFVPGWSARHEPEPSPGGADGSRWDRLPPLPLALGATALLLLAWPSRLAGLRRWRKRARGPSGRRAQGP
jgi:hypothetical protein